MISNIKYHSIDLLFSRFFTCFFFQCALLSSSVAGEAPSASVAEDSPVGTRVLLLQTKEPVNYFILNSVDEPFTVDSCTGWLEVGGVLDYEQDTEHKVYITAVSITTNTTILVIVSVTDVNDNAPTCPRTAYTTNIAANAPLGSIVLNLATFCSDADKTTQNGRISYFLESGAGGYFSIDLMSGQIKLVRALNASHVTSVFNLIVQLRDGGSPQKTFPVQVNVDIQPANTAAPMFNSSSYVFSINEGLSGSLGVVWASDADEAPRNKVTYSLVQPVGLSVSINNSTGQINLLTPLDYETNARSYVLTVKATDSASVGAQRSSTARVTVNILDINEPPRFVQSLSNITLSERDPSGTVVSQFKCNDVEGGIINYRILNGNINSSFAINSVTGNLTVAKTLNAEAIDKYSLVISCQDNNTSPLSANTTLNIALRPENEFAPVFGQASYTFQVNETLAAGSLVGRVRATDGDTGLQGRVSYQLVQSRDSPLFSINRTTGEIRSKVSFDFEATTQYRLTAVASDMATAPLVTTVDITVAIMDANDHIPVFSMATYQQTITSSYATGRSVLQLSCSDGDALDQGRLTYSIASFLPAAANVPQPFLISRGTGLITVRNTSLLAESRFVLTAQCQDLAGQSSTTSVNLTVVSSIPNLAAPIFQPLGYSVMVAENTKVGSSIATVLATDTDPGLTGEVLYSVLPSTDSDLITVNSDLGVVYLAEPLDYEKKSMYALLVRATDKGSINSTGSPAFRHSDAWFNITVVDVTTPRFRSPVYYFAVKEKETAPQPVGIVSCIDGEDNGTDLTQLTYGLAGAGSADFAIDMSGVITVSRKLEYENEPPLVFNVTCALGGAMSLATVNITLTSVSDCDPFLTLESAFIQFQFPGFYSILVPENISRSAIPVQLIAEDCDHKNSVGGNVTFFAELAPTPFISPVTFNSTTGAATVNPNFKWRRLAIFRYNIHAKDDSGRMSNLLQAVILVEDVNTEAPMITADTYSLTLNEDTAADKSLLQLTCLDNDHQSLGHGNLTMSVTSSVPNLFILTVSGETSPISGNLTLRSNAALMAAPSDNITVIVHCEDSGTPPLFTTTTITVLVNRLNTYAPMFLASSYSATVAENLAVGSTVVMVSASDRDTSDRFSTITYSLVGGNTNSAFYINITTGLISVNAPLDYETQKTYTLKVQANDTERTSLADVNITLQDVNDRAPAFPLPVYNVSVPSSAKKDFVVFSQSASDDDTVSAGKLTYSLSNLFNTSLLVVDPITGLVTVNQQLPLRDFSFVLVVSDEGNLLGNTTVNVFVANIQALPEFAKMQYQQEVYENRKPPSHLADFSATFTTPVEFSIVSGNSDARFAMTPTGSLSLVRSLDFETRKSYVLIIQAQSKANPLAKAQEVYIIHVRDVNDHTPVPLQINQTVILENQENNSVVATVMCFDPDNGANGTVVYMNVSGSTRGLLRLNSTSGAITLEKALDELNDNSSYVLTISCSDRGTPPRRSNVTMSIRFNLYFENFPPALQFPPMIRSVSESAGIGTSVARIIAQDAGVGIYGELVYSILAGDSLRQFSINSIGVISVAKKLDREENDYYSLQIRIADKAPNSLFIMTTQNITVDDVNDNNPVLTPTGEVNVQVPGQSKVGTVILSFSATDADLGNNGNVTLRIETASGLPSNPFRIQGLDLILAKPLDRASTLQYSFSVIASDQGTPVLQSPSASVTVIVLGSAPVFANTSYSVALLDSLTVKSHVVFVSASDPDTDSSDMVYYDILSGNTGNTFSIAQCSGNITLNQPLNAGVVSQYNLLVAAFVRGQARLQSNVSVVVTVLDDNEPPMCGDGTYSVNIYEGTQALGRVPCTDRDTGSNNMVHYSLSESHDSRLLINSSTGELSLGFVHYVLSKTCYRSTVNATDGGAPPLTTVVTISVCILPRITLSPASSSQQLSESSRLSTGVEQYTAQDLVDATAVIQYSIVAGNVGNVFSIDASGSVTVQSSLDYENVRRYDLTIQAKTSAQGASDAKAQATLVVLVTDANDNAPIISPSQLVVTFNESVAAESVVAVFTCTDPDSGVNGEKTFAISQGNTNSTFTINSTSGEVSLNRMLDFETMSDRQFSLNIRCSDGGATSLFNLATLIVQLSNINEHAPAFTPSSSYAAAVGELAAIGDTVETVTAIDDDSDTVSYMLLNSTGLPFSLDSRLGRLQVSRTLDYDTRNSYQLSVQASDGMQVSLATINVTVTDGNNHAPEFNQSVYDLILSESTNVNTEVLRVSCSDGDHGSNAQVSYSVPDGSLSSYLDINASTGAVVLSRSLDFETLSSLSVKLECMDGGTPRLTGKSDVLISVLGANEHAPTFTAGSANASIDEDFAVGMVITTVSAMDDDKGVDGQVSYSIQSGNNAGTFRLIASSGELVLLASLDFETQSQYSLVIRASDPGGKFSTVTLNITVMDLNDASPQCNPSSYDIRVPETVPPDHQLAQLTCNDDDAEDMLQYDVDSSLVNVSSTGSVLTTQAVDAVSHTRFTLTITVSDSATPPHSTQVLMTVTVFAVNEYSPVFSMPRYTANIYENATTGHLLQRVSASDRDSGSDGRIQYALLPTSSPGPFALNLTDGAITLTSSLDYEAATAYTLDVIARDGGSPQRSSTAVVTINVLDLDDNAPVLSPSTQTVRVSANQTGGAIVAVLSVDDADSPMFSKHSCAIVNGNTKNLFSLKDNVQVIVSTNIRAISDVRQSGMISLDIECADLNNTMLAKTSARVIIDVVVVDLNAPVFNASIPLNVTILENAPLSSTVLTLHAIDPDDVSNPVTYCIVQSNSSAFVLDSQSGELQVSSVLDREKQSSYSLTVSAIDSGTCVDQRSGQTFATVDIVVGDVNDNSPELQPSLLVLSVAEATAIGSVLGQLTCIDADIGSNGMTTVQVTGQQNVIDVLSNGTVLLNSTLDVSTMDSYLFNVECRDAGSPQRQDTATISLRVAPSNQDRPDFMPAFYSISVAEDAAFGDSILSLTAMDSDSGSAGAFVFSLVGGSAGGLFSLNEQTGVLSVLGSLDFERQKNYTLVASVDNPSPYKWSCNGSSTIPCLSQAVINITVRDVNDNVPRCNPTQYRLRTNETTPVGTVLASLNCSDLDTGLNGQLRYSLQARSVNFGSALAVGAASGEIFVAGNFSRLQSSFYTLWVDVTDMGSPPTQTALVFIYLEVQAVNIFAPVFSNTSYKSSVLENVAIGTTVAAVSATDADMQPLAYSIVGGDPKDQFTIRTSSGQILTSRGLDREVINSYSLLVNATDNSQPRALVSQTQVDITVLDFNDHVPLYSPEFYSARLNESYGGQHIIQLNCTDGDEIDTNNTLLSYSIVSGNASMFNVNSTGAVSLAVRNSLDYETDTLHRLIIECSDAGVPRLSSNAVTLVTVLPVNEFTPRFAMTEYNYTIAESNGVGFVFATLTATDGDNGADGMLAYSIVSGNTPTTFFLDSKTGSLGLTRTLDRQQDQMFRLVIAATDGGGLAGSTVVIVNISDVNNNDPVCSRQTFSFRTSESVTSRVTVGQLACSDLDTGTSGLLRYTITAGDTRNQFTIDQSDGRVFVTGPLSRRVQAVYSLLVDVSDQGSPPRSISITVLVEVQAVNRFAPVFLSPMYSANILENATVGTTVAQVNATDADSEEFGRVSYAITAGNDNKVFLADMRSGAIVLASSLDFENDPFYNLTLEASDGAPLTLRRATSIPVSLTVVNLNDNPPRFSSSVYSATVNESAAVGTTVARVVCTDADTPSATQAATYTIASGNGAGLYSLHTGTGVVTVARSLAGQSVSTILTVLCTDLGPGQKLSASADLGILVATENNFAPVFSQDNYNVTVSEGSALGTQVAVVMANDSDTAGASSIQYSIVGGNSDSKFLMDPVTGNITILSSLDREVVSSYLLAVRASDGKSDSSDSFVAVAVSDVNDNSPVVTPAIAFAPSFVQTASLPRALTTLTCTDADLNPSLTFSFRTANTTVLSSFSIDMSGSVSVIRQVPPDNYLLPIQCSDGNTVATATVSVIVTPGTLVVPQFDDSNYVASLIENTLTFSAVVQVVLRGSPSLGTYKFSVVSGNEAGQFDLNERTGELFQRNALDREQRGSYVLNVTASPAVSFNGTVMVSSTLITITVIDQNDVQPQISPRVSILSVDESVPRGTILQSFRCVDGDVTGSNNSMTTISFAQGSNSPLFALRVRNATHSDLYLQGNLDYENGTFHAISIVCRDAGLPQLSSMAAVSLTVLAVNEHAPQFGPEFTATLYNATVYENATAGSEVVLVKAVDSDSVGHGSIVYNLTGGDGKFTIGVNTGSIRLTSLLDASQQNYYVLTVTAMDNTLAVGSVTYTTTALVGIVVLEARQDHAPVLTPANLVVRVPENATLGTPLATFTCTDGDGDTTALTIPQQPDGTGRFALSATGDLLLDHALNIEAKDSYSFVVECSDQRSNSLIDTSIVTVIVLPINEFIPSFNASSYSAQVPENFSVGQEVVSVFAFDGDDGEHGRIEYEITAGNDEGKFDIAVTQGVIYLNGLLDYESIQLYTLTVVAFEVRQRNRRNSTVVVVRVTNINDNDPTCNPNVIRPTLPAGASTGFVVTTLNCSDGDNTAAGGDQSSLLYTIVSSSQSRNFNITANGQLVLVRSIATTHDQIVNLQINILDGGSPPRQTSVVLFITVPGLADSTPMFLSPLYSTNISDLAPLQTFVIRVQARDADAGQVLNYSLYSPQTSDLRLFSINPSDGVISLAKTFDTTLPTPRLYNLTAVVRDNGMPVRSSTVSVVVLVYRGDEQRLVVIPSSPRLTILENTAVNTKIAELNCTDDRGRYDSNYYINLTSGNVFSTFSITQGRFLNIARQINDSLLSYTLTFTCFDRSSPGRQTIPAIILVTVTAINNHVPIFTTNSYTDIVMEDAFITQTILSVHADDDDFGSHGQVHYFIDSGNTNDDLILDELTGVLFVGKSLDRERTTSYQLVVLAKDTDSQGNTFEGFANVSISVIDVNDNPPVFKPLIRFISVPDDISNGIVIANVTASDTDTGNNSLLSFVLTSGNVGNAFSLIQTSNDVADIIVNSTLNAHILDQYKLVITATDGGQPAMAGMGTVIVSINGINLYTPVFMQPTYRVNVSEAASPGDEIAAVSATDADMTGPDGMVEYRILGGNDDNTFLIDEQSGQVFLRGHVDYEAVRKYNLTIQAYDQGQPSRASIAHVAVDVIDVNDNNPVCNMTSVTVQIPEGNYTQQPQLVARVFCNDIDSGLNSALQYALDSNATGNFAVDQVGNVWAVGVLEASIVDFYNLLVVVSDRGIPASINANVYIAVSVTPVNDYAPMFVPDYYAAGVDENSSPTTFILQVTATDRDGGRFGRIEYQLAVPDANLPFYLDPTNGEISVRAGLDREQTSEYLFSVLAVNIDPMTGAIEQNDTALVNITVGDYNDNGPVFFPASYTTNFTEDNQPGVEVATVTASDADVGNNADISYTILSGNEGGQFRILSNGTILATRVLDYEMHQIFSLVVEAADAGQSPMRSRAVVTVMILNVNDNPPLVIPSSYQESVSENDRIGTLVKQIVAQDSDNTIAVLSPLVYSISSGNVGNAFSIDQSGRILINTTLDFEQLNSYSLNVSVSDGTFATSALVNIQVIDSNDNNPIFYPATPLTVTLVEGTAAGFEIVRVYANDSDASTNGQIVYSLLSTNSTEEAGQFIDVNPVTGAVTTKEIARYDNESASVVVIISARDAGTPQLSGYRTIFINVVDINDNAPIFDSDVYLFNVSEDANGTADILGYVQATDLDDGSNANITYRLIAGDQMKLFFIDAVSGEVSLNGTLDREMTAEYTLTVQASDFGIPPRNATCTIIVTVLDVSDTPPQFSHDGQLQYIAENAPSGTNVVLSDAVDPDENDVLRYELLVQPLVEIDGALVDAALGTDIFSINNNTGQVFTTDAANTDGVRQWYNLTVTVTDGIFNTSQTFRVRIGFVNLQAPMFTALEYFGTLNMDAAITASAVISRVSAIDTDKGVFGNVSYSFKRGTWTRYFSIDNNSGIITQSQQLPMAETSAPRQLVVLATDGGGRSSEASVSVYTYDNSNLIELWFSMDEEQLSSEQFRVLEAFNEISTKPTNRISGKPFTVTGIPSNLISAAAFVQSGNQISRRKRQSELEANTTSRVDPPTEGMITTASGPASNDSQGSGEVTSDDTTVITTTMATTTSEIPL